MLRRVTLLVLLAAPGGSLPAWAQAPLSVADAVVRARDRKPDARAAASLAREAGERVTQARAGLLPRLDAAESWQRGDQPVFVFSSLLGQRRFAAADFALDALNHPGALDNFRTSLSVEQPLFDPVSRAAVRAARAGETGAALAAAQVAHEIAFAVTDAYGRVLLAEAREGAAAASIAAATADHARAAARRDAGLVTEADVLQLDMHVSRARAAKIRAGADAAIARANLNALMGEPLDARFTLMPIAAPAEAAAGLEALEAEALGARPDVDAARVQEAIAAAGEAAARAAFLPRIAAHGVWELNGGAWGTRASSWTAGVTARIDLFSGFADRARLAEARERAGRRAIERAGAETAIRLEVRAAAAGLGAARARLEAIGAAHTQAREARRIIRDRYEHGLADVAALLRAAEAEEEAATSRLAAEIDLAVAAASLHRALGRT
jgi:outer membrane protein